MDNGNRLAQKAHGAFRLLSESNFKQRAKRLELVDERGFALILYWNQIEAALKLARYAYDIQGGWPDKLDFIRASWSPLKRLKLDNCDEYEFVLGNASSSLRNRRNEIAHAGCNISEVDFGKYVKSAQWAIAGLEKEVPKLSQLRDKKRRSDAQKCR